MPKNPVVGSAGKSPWRVFSLPREMSWLAQQQLKSRSPRIRSQAIRRLSRMRGQGIMLLIRRMLAEDPDGEVRVAAAEALGGFGDPRSVEGLAAAIRDPVAEVRLACVDALRRLGDPSAGLAVSRLLESEDTVTRSRAALALRSLGWKPSDEWREARYLVALGELERAALLGAPAVEPLTRMLRDSAYQRRVVAVNLLAEIGDPQSLPLLRPGLDDADGLVRAATARAVGRMRDRDSWAKLASLMDDKDANVRVAAAAALGQLGEESGVEALLRGLHDAHWEVRATAAEALGWLRAGRALPDLVSRLKDEDREVRERAAEALGQLGDVSALEGLLGCTLDRESPVRHAALRALQRVDPYWERTQAATHALPLLEQARRKGDAGVQSMAIELLRRIERMQGARGPAESRAGSELKRGERLVRVLTALLDDPDPALRQASVEAWQHRDRGQAPARLNWLVHDPDPSVRVAAGKFQETGA